VDIFAILILVMMAVIAYLIVTTIKGREQLNVQSRYSPEEAARAVSQGVGGMWKPVDGRGQLNFKQRLKRGAPTISVDLVPDTQGCRVDIWVSAWEGKWGLMNHGGSAWRKKNAIARMVSSAPAVRPTQRPA
jgi:hypothetical protein